MSRDLDVQYKTAFVLAHKLREAMGAEMKDRTLNGHVEIDGAYFGGYLKPENWKDQRVDRRRKEFQTGKRRAVVIMRERKGRSLPFVFEREDDSLPTVHQRIEPGTTIYADEASCWDGLHARFATKRINHSLSFVDEDCCTNQAESYFSRLRRMEIGTHHRVSGRYLQAYANEAAWREDNRRRSNGTLYLLATSAAMAHPVSKEWKGYWQRREA